MTKLGEMLVEDGIKRGIERGLEEGMEKGLQKGKAEGKAEGRQEEKHSIALNLKKLGVSIEQIAFATGLLAGRAAAAQCLDIRE